MEILGLVSMETVELVVQAAFATGAFGWGVRWLWRRWRRPRLSICYDPEQRPKHQTRRGFVEDPPGSLSLVGEYVAVVRNDGKTAARSVEATAELLEWWDGEEWHEEKSLYSPTPLVWSGTHQTRAHVPPDGRGRELAVFVAGPLKRRTPVPMLHFAIQSAYTGSTPPMQAIRPEKVRVRIEVASEGGVTASCEMAVDWNPAEPDELPAEGDCVRSSC